VRPTNVLIILERGRGLNSWLERLDRGEVTETVPYGYRSNSPDWELAFSTDEPELAVARLFRRAALRVLGFDLVHVWRHRSEARASDIVWTHTEHVHLAYTFLRIFLKGLPPALAQSIWIPAELPHTNPARRALYTWLLSRSDIHVVQSRLNSELLELVTPHNEVSLVLFGISPQAFEQIGPVRNIGGRRLRVLGVGNDRHRDWDLLVDAGRLLQDEAEFRILTRAQPSRSLPSNLVQAPARELSDLRDAYEWADVVCLPLLDNQHASGITVALEAVYSGRPLLMTNAGGLDSYFPGFLKFALRPGSSADEWAAAIRELRANYTDRAPEMVTAARSDADTLRLDSDGYSQRLIDVSRRILERK
jgi:glycosyltransferase involved in cell wall biosynthesis